MALARVAAEGAAPPVAPGRRTGPAEGARGRRRRVRGEAVEAAARGTSPSPGHLRRRLP